MKQLFLLLTVLIFIAGCNKEKLPADVPQESEYEIINIFPHDTSYFTQGFEFAGDTLVEGTGIYGSSKLIKYDAKNSDVYSEINLQSDYFGEGITVLNGKIYQLTWTNGKCFVYDYLTMEAEGSFSYSGYGWGLCNDGSNLIMSNGSSTLYYRDPADFSVIRTISVKDSNNSAVSELNELEFAEGRIYANIWGADHIVSIDPQTGLVLRKYYMSDLRQQAINEFEYSNVLNGIAYRNGNFFVTGKYWPFIFEISLTDN
jgi:glutamine cyclotransferase